MVALSKNFRATPKLFCQKRLLKTLQNELKFLMKNHQKAWRFWIALKESFIRVISEQGTEPRDREIFVWISHLKGRDDTTNEEVQW